MTLFSYWGLGSERRFYSGNFSLVVGASEFPSRWSKGNVFWKSIEREVVESWGWVVWICLVPTFRTVSGCCWHRDCGMSYGTLLLSTIWHVFCLNHTDSMVMIPWLGVGMWWFSGKILQPPDHTHSHCCLMFCIDCDTWKWYFFLYYYY